MKIKDTAQYILPLVALATACCLIYSNTLLSPFILDDDIFILKDSNIRVTELSVDNFIRAAFEGRPHRRLLPNLSFAVNYYFGRYDVAGYHVVNIAIHLIISILLFSLFKATLKIAPNCDMNSYGYARIAFFATLLWLVHPVATQSVTYVCQRMTSMAALFYVLSLLLYVKGRIIQRSAKLDVSMDRPKVVTPTNPGVQDTLQTLDSGLRRKDNQREFLTLLNIIKIKPALLFAGCILSGVAAVASKENAAMLPAFILLYEWFFFQDLKFTWSYNKVLWISVPAILFCLIALAYLGENPLSGILGIYSRRDFTLIQRVMTEWRVVIYYITLLFFPAPGRLNLEHDYPLSVAPIHPWTTLFSLTAIFCLILISLYTAKRHRLVSFCILWFLGNLAIESTVIGLEIIFEHRTYLPFLMPCLMAAGLAARICPSPKAFISLMCAATTLFSIWTYQRNGMWQNEITFCQDCVDKSPLKFRSHNNLGIALHDAGQFKNAIDCYQTAINIDPDHIDIAATLNNIGSAWLKLGRADEAISYFNQALNRNPLFASAQINLGAALITKNQIPEAIEHFIAILKQDPGHAEAHVNLGDGLDKMGHTNEAINHYRKALQIKPDFTEAFLGLGNALYKQGRIDEAISYYLQALQAKPDFAEAYNSLGIAHIRKGDMDGAIANFREALRLNPGYVSAKHNLEKLQIIKQP
jgi:tetratricopeptide (TPR) repeat protein